MIENNMLPKETNLDFFSKKKAPKPAVVMRSEINSTEGEILVESYDDGEALLKFPSVDGWFVLDIFARERLAAFLANQYIAKSKSSPVGTVVKAAVKVPFTKNILQEAELWGVNVAPDVRYYYSSRNAARKADLAHQVGVGGRVR